MIKWTEQDVIDAVRLAMEEAAAMPSPQQMMQELMTESQVQLVNGSAGGSD